MKIALLFSSKARGEASRMRKPSCGRKAHITQQPRARRCRERGVWARSVRHGEGECGQAPILEPRWLQGLDRGKRPTFLLSCIRTHREFLPVVLLVCWELSRLALVPGTRPDWQLREGAPGEWFFKRFWLGAYLPSDRTKASCNRLLPFCSLFV
jgi:hypothetical protein